MPEPAQIVVVGSVNVDHVVTATRFPAPGETVAGTSIASSIGGKGANQAVAAALAGASVTMVASTGDDVDGANARARLTEHGVHTTHVAVWPSEPTGTAWITVAEGDNTIIVVPGANACWAPDALPLIVADAAIVVCQLEIPLDVVCEVAERSAGTFVLNAAPAAALPDQLLARCDVLVVNEHELAAVADTTATADDEGIVAAHAKLRQRGVGAVVTTRGAAGAVVTDETGHTTMLPAIPSGVVDTTGAGDAFVGVVVARLSLGEPLVAACRWGIVAGSLAVRGLGAQESYPDLPTLTHAIEEFES
ncbi:ribokinase [Mycobacterium sp. BMJ-28]